MRRSDWRMCWTAARALGVAFLVISCDSTEPGKITEPVEGLRLEARSDTALTGTVGAKVASIPVVRLTLDGNPAPGREVQFLVSGGGSIEVVSERTDTAGLASPGAWTLGTAARPQTLTARINGVAAQVFTAVAKAGPIATVDLVAGNKQTGAVGTPLPTSLRVRLADHYGNPVLNEPVTFAVTAGHGTILGDQPMTDSLGLASAGTWTLGDAGVQLVRASAAGHSVLFEAFACDDPCPGQELVFTRGSAAYTYSLVSGATTRLISFDGNPGWDAAGDVAWSRDGRRIAFTNYHGFDYDDQVADLYVMDADGSNAELRATGFWEPSWSPDGTQLIATGVGGVYILSADPDGTTPVLLAENAYAPAWSPDGAKIAYAMWEGTASSLKVMNPDGSAVTTLRHGQVGYPAWSPDGQRLAFMEYVPQPAPQVGASNLFTIRPDGTDLVQLTYVTDVVEPSWSPDGSRIAFLSLSERSEPRGLFWIPADGSLHRPIPILPDVGSFAWRP
ncbi:MAG TPA: hypothetical protein VFN83_08845 [Gemmatimonadales bacterium]|nr:hypothetical protein [Gemmatimonadales bacterium]